METEKLIVAIDLGSSYITGIAGRKEGEKIRIKAIENEPSNGAIRRGCIANIEETASKIKKLVTKLENNLSSKVERVYVGIGGQSVRSIKHSVSRHLPEGTIISSKLTEELYNDGRNFSISNSEIVDIIPNEAIVNDFIVADPENINATKIQIDMQLAVARQSLKKNIKTVFERVGIPLAGVILSSRADATAVLTADDKQAGCVLINFGGGTTTVSVYCGGFLRYFTTIPLGGKDITRDIISLGFVEKEAERYKITLGSAILSNGEQLKGIILEGTGKSAIKPKDLNRTAVARIEEIVLNAVNQIKESGYKSQLKGGIIMTGNASLLKDLPELLHKESGMEVRCGSVAVNAIAEKGLNLQLSSFSQAIGMIMLGNEACITCHKEKETKEKSKFWPFDNNGKDNNKNTVKPVEKQQPKPIENKEEKKSLGIFDKIRTQVIKIMDEGENEEL